MQIKELWEQISDDLSPTVCLLVEACLTDREEDSNILKWCVEYGFELVVWNYKNETTTDEGIIIHGTFITIMSFCNQIK